MVAKICGVGTSEALRYYWHKGAVNAELVYPLRVLRDSAADYSYGRSPELPCILRASKLSHGLYINAHMLYLYL
jgi:hypothetical protein